MPIRLSDMTIEEVLNLKGIRRYSKVRIDDRIVYMVHEPLDLSAQHLRRLPNLTDLVVGGSFNCSGNDIVSFRGCPREVGGDLICDRNPQLPNLYGLPGKVGGKIISDFGEFDSLTALRQATPELLRADYRKPKPQVGLAAKLFAVIGLDQKKLEDE